MTTDTIRYSEVTELYNASGKFEYKGRKVAIRRERGEHTAFVHIDWVSEGGVPLKLLLADPDRPIRKKEDEPAPMDVFVDGDRVGELAYSTGSIPHAGVRKEVEWVLDAARFAVSKNRTKRSEEQRKRGEREAARVRENLRRI